jgi:putative DNA methylase
MTSDHPVKRRKKLIEVAIPLEAINAASAREKSIRHGHPSTLHLWWARRPLAAARAVIFCQLVDDPSAVPEEFPTEEDQEHERLRLFALISELVLWESTTNEEVLERARAEIRRSWRRACADNTGHPEAAELFNPEKLPGFHDPFAGGGALPLEAQRLGLEAYASDLNPVAVLINKAMIEIPPKFAGMPPINPEASGNKELLERKWKRAEGLAEDIRYYGKWIRDEAEKRVGHLYPRVQVTQEMCENRPDIMPYLGQKLTVLAWIWARTVKSPNPTFSNIEIPLAKTYCLSSKRGKECHATPVVRNEYEYRFSVHKNAGPDFDASKNGSKLGKGANFKCILSGDVVSAAYIKSEAQQGRMGARLIAIVADTGRERVFLGPVDSQEVAARSLAPKWIPSIEFFEHALGFRIGNYGMTKWSDLYTQRQLCFLSEVSGLVTDAVGLLESDLANRCDSMSQWQNASEDSRQEYTLAIATYLGLTASKAARFSTTLSTWRADEAKLSRAIPRADLPMTWDFAETNPFSGSGGDIQGLADGSASVIEGCPGLQVGLAKQLDARQAGAGEAKRVISTDPPYYDNIGYSDLSDYFYVWLRRSLKDFYPDLLATVQTPKAQELVATPKRHGGKKLADEYFLKGMRDALETIRENSSPAFPLTIYYAFKQAETDQTGSASTGWETFLEAVIQAGLIIQGTWPVRTEGKTRMRSMGSNALASSVVLVCQPRMDSAITLSRNEFRRQLRQELPKALKKLERANIAPVDVAQAAIGPGMAIYSSAKAVLNPDDSPMSVREALIEINAALDEYLSEDEGDLDADSRFALTFFESFGYAERDFGDAEGLAMARNLSVDGVARAGILRSVSGKVQLLQRSDLPEDWDPSKDKRLCVWEATQQLIKRLETGEQAAAALLAQLKEIPGHGDLPANCRALSYRLYNHCEKTKQAEEARAYNGLVIAWTELEKLAAVAASPVQPSLL